MKKFFQLRGAFKTVVQDLCLKHIINYHKHPIEDHSCFVFSLCSFCTLRFAAETYFDFTYHTHKSTTFTHTKVDNNDLLILDNLFNHYIITFHYT